MTQYLISIKDDLKANHVLALLRDLAYIDILKRETQTELKKFASSRKRLPSKRKRLPSKRKRLPSKIITPISVDNFKIFNREELNERL